MALFASTESHSGVASSLGQSWRKECRRQREAIPRPAWLSWAGRQYGQPSQGYLIHWCAQLLLLLLLLAATSATAAAAVVVVVVLAVMVTKKYVVPVRDGDSLSCGARPSFPGRQFRCNSWRTITKVSRDPPAIGPLRQRLKWPTYGIMV